MATIGEILKRLERIDRGLTAFRSLHRSGFGRFPVDINPTGEPRYSEYLDYLQKVETENDLKEALKTGSSETLEILESIPDSKALAKLICGLLNTSGGSILFGISSKGIVKGVDNNSLARIYRGAKKLLDSDDNSTLYFIPQSTGMPIGIIAVPFSGDKIISLSNSGIAYERNGSKTIHITAERIKQFLCKSLPKGESESHIHIDSIASKVEDLTKRIIESLSWRNKIYNILLAGIVGAVISLGLSLLLAM